MRKGEDHGVMTAEGLGVGLHEHPVGQWGEVGVDRSERLAGIRGGGEGTHLEVGVLEQEAHDLASRIPARPGDRHAHHVHDYTEPSDSIHPDTARGSPTSSVTVSRTRLWDGLSATD